MHAPSAGAVSGGPTTLPLVTGWQGSARWEMWLAGGGGGGWASAATN
jgi:hypothetical protein